MKKILSTIFLFTLVLSHLQAGDALTVLLLPENASQGYSAMQDLRPDKQVNFTYATWFSETDYSSIGLQLGKMNYGFKGLISSQIPVYGDQPSDEPAGNTQYSNICFYAGTRLDLTDRIFVDVRAKVLNESLFYASAWGGAADIQLLLTNHVNYTLFGGVSDLGAMTKLDEEATELPTRIYAGGNVIFNFFNASLQAGTDLDLTPYVRLGISYLHPVFDLSYSYDSLLEINHVGAGIKWNKLSVGYGLFMHADGLGNTSMFTLGIKI